MQWLEIQRWLAQFKTTIDNEIKRQKEVDERREEELMAEIRRIDRARRNFEDDISRSLNRAADEQKFAADQAYYARASFENFMNSH